MTRLLPRLLDARELPAAELRAARMDGQLFAVDGMFAPIGEPDSSGLRAAALEGLVPERMIVERASALWVHGVRACPPFRHQVCMDISHRTTPPHALHFEFRECRIGPGDVVRFGAVRVTSPVRTAIDLLRTCESFSASDAVDVLAVLQVGGADVSECRRRIRSQARFPGVRRALARAAALECSGPMPFLQAGAAVSRR